MGWHLSLIVLASWVSLILAWASLGLAIAGLSLVQSSCVSSRLNLLLSGVSNLSNAGTSCNRFFTYQWFTVLFIVMLLTLVTCCAFSTRCFYALRTPLLPMFSVAIVLSMQVCLVGWQSTQRTKRVITGDHMQQGADTFVKMYDHVEINGDPATQAAITFSGVLCQMLLCPCHKNTTSSPTHPHPVGFVASAVILCALVIAFSASFEYKSSPRHVAAQTKAPRRVVDETTGTNLVANSSIPPLPPPRPREEA